MANVLRCSRHGDSNLSNASLVDNISYDRIVQAKILGYQSYAEMTMSTKMVGSLENVDKFLNSLLKAGIDDSL